MPASPSTKRPGRVRIKGGEGVKEERGAKKGGEEKTLPASLTTFHSQ